MSTTSTLHGDATPGWLSGTTVAQCEYCGDFGPVKDEPFGQEPACWDCWTAVCYGSEDE